MSSIVTAAPRRIPRKGKADIGGRMRVAQILRSAGITGEAPERIAGATNEVWKSGDYIVRVGFVPGAERLRREARLAQILPPEVQYPKVVQAGIESFGEWIVVRNRAGIPLSEAWMRMDGPQRQDIIHDLATTLKAVHDTRLTPEQQESLEFHEGSGLLALPHQLPSERVLELLEQARYLPDMDRGLIDAAMQKTDEIGDAIWAHERNGLVHGDLHFENVLVRDGVIISVLDFEWSRPGPREIDIDVLARFCADPAMHVGGDYPIHKDDFRDVLRWLYEAYPELFSAENILDRLMLCALSFEVPWLLRMPPNGPAASLPPFHPLNQIRDLLDKGTHAERLGWKPLGE